MSTFPHVMAQVFHDLLDRDVAGSSIWAGGLMLFSCWAGRRRELCKPCTVSLAPQTRLPKTLKPSRCNDILQPCILAELPQHTRNGTNLNPAERHVPRTSILECNGKTSQALQRPGRNLRRFNPVPQPLRTTGTRQRCSFFRQAKCMARLGQLELIHSHTTSNKLEM